MDAWYDIMHIHAKRVRAVLINARCAGCEGRLCRPRCGFFLFFLHAPQKTKKNIVWLSGGDKKVQNTLILIISSACLLG